MGIAVNYNPDILSCLANLSNDEVFTPPELVNRILDMLPSELWANPDTRVLDPCSKSGVFLREIAKRMIEGEKNAIPDLQERIDHIFHKQLYGIAITELTSLLSRRSLYCSKMANGQYSVSQFKTPGGNIIYRKRQHTWDGDRCLYCDAPKKEYDRPKDLESYAYEFIHLTNKETKELSDMHFDLIIGNPPYQLSDGGAQSSATPIYHLFIQQAKKLNPNYLSMIIPARWYAGGKGLDAFRDEMLHDHHMVYLHDFPDSSECFTGVQIKGGICYFLWSRNANGKCTIINHHKGESSSPQERFLIEDGCDTFIRYNKAISIFHKVLKNQGSGNLFDSLVSGRKPFGLSTAEKGHSKRNEGDIRLYGNKSISYIPRAQIIQGTSLIDGWKLFISYAYGAGEDFPHQIINKPFIGEPGSVCTETYLVIGPFRDKIEASNAMSYMSTKFFRFMVLLLKNTQHATKTVYKLVPMQDFSKPWTDEELYKKYDLTDDEIAFIESMIRPMDLSNDKEGGSV